MQSINKIHNKRPALLSCFNLRLSKTNYYSHLLNAYSFKISLVANCGLIIELVNYVVNKTY